MELGLSLNKYKNLVVLQAETPEELIRKIQTIRCMVEVIQIYFDGNKHIAWIVTEKKLIKKIN